MKKLLAVILCFAMLLSVTAVLAAGESEKVYPVVLLQGYSGPTLINEDTGEQVWGLDFDKVKDRILEKLPQIGQGIVDRDLLVEALGGVLLETLEPIACNPDGTSKYNVTNTPKGAAATRVSVLREQEGGSQFIPEPEFVEMMGEEIGYDNIFAFSFDWRKGQIEYAKAIDEYIAEVKELTGSDKVNIFGLSHGGQCGASYLYYYGYKKDVNKAMLEAPAIGGTSIVGELFTGGEVDIDYSAIVEFAQQGFGIEEDWQWLLERIGFENLNAVINRVLQEYAYDFAKYFPSLWDFVPVNYFDKAMERANFTLAENGALLTQTTLHHEAMSRMSEGLKRAQSFGIDIAIVAGTGIESFTGNGSNSDYIIDTYSSTGAVCTPVNEIFSADYAPQGTVCANPAHWHISPERCIDASAGYLPDNTWFVNGQFHGTYIFDNYTKGLVHDFLLTDKITDVFSDTRYPQFESAQNPVDGIYARFDKAAAGFRTTADSALLLKNLSENTEAVIWDIKAEGADIEFDFERGMSLPRGKIAEIPIKDGDYSAYTLPFTVTVRYSLRNTQMTFVTKDFAFTPLNESQAKAFAYMTAPPKIEPVIYEEDTAPSEPSTAEPSTQETTETAAEPTSEAPATETAAPEPENEALPDTDNGRVWIIALAGLAPVGLAVLCTVPAVKKRKIKI